MRACRRRVLSRRRRLTAFWHVPQLVPPAERSEEIRDDSWRERERSDPIISSRLDPHLHTPLRTREQTHQTVTVGIHVKSSTSHTGSEAPSSFVKMGEPGAEPTVAQNQGSGGDSDAPPWEQPSFPRRRLPQQGQQQALTPALIRPPPGGLTQSPEELTRQVGWQALAAAVTHSATSLYPDDPQAVALTVASSLQPYMTAFAPRGKTGFFTEGTPGGPTSTPLSKTTESIVLGAITGNKSHEVAKYQHTFPSFPGDRCRDDVDLWEKYWESVYGFQKVVRCDDNFLALMIKETADKHSSLSTTLEHLKYSDGTFDAAGFDGIRGCMEEDYAPRGHAIRGKARNTLFYRTFRKFKEKPRWFFRRVDKNLKALDAKDEGTCVSDDYLAELYLHKCGLSRAEQKDIFEKAGGEWDPERIKQAILTYYEQAHELDESRILNSRGSRNHPRGVNFVKHNPSGGVEGTDLTPDMVEEYDPSDDLDTTGDTFNPANPTYLSTRCDEDEETEPPTEVFWTNNPFDDGSEDGTSSDHDHDHDAPDGSVDDSDEDDHDTEGNSSDENSEDSEGLTEAVGDIFEQGYLRAMEEQGVELEDGISTAQRNVYLTTWKGARKFRSRSKDKKGPKDRRKRRPDTPRPDRSGRPRKSQGRSTSRSTSRTSNNKTNKKGPRRGMSQTRG